MAARQANLAWETPHAVLGQADAMGTMQRIAPIFDVHDLDAAMRHYQRLGFTVRAYAEGAVVDPDGNVIRFGSPMGKATQS